MKSIKHELMARCFPEGMNEVPSNTRKVYQNSCKEFAQWCKIESISKNEIFSKSVEVVQKYERHLEKREYSPSTIHIKLAPLCKGTEISMDNIEKPSRTSRHITRSTHQGNKQGEREARSERHSDLVEFQRCVGIRRSEIKALKPVLVTDESGYKCIEVERGKGGKYQLQRILPENLERVIHFLEGRKNSERVFTSQEMNNKIDLHSMRAEVAKQAYAHYLERCQTGKGRTVLQQELLSRYRKYNTKDITSFETSLEDTRPYLLRGSNKEVALKNGRPIVYDRLAVLAVSVFHLSHWRTDVAVTNYLIK